MLDRAAHDGATPEQVTLWLQRLAAMIGKAHFHTDEEWTTLLDLYVPGLCLRFEAGAFTGRSLEGCAVQCRRWPGYAELVDMLTVCLREQRSPAVEDASLVSLAVDQRHWVSWWHRTALSTRDLAHLASLVRSQAPEAWDHLVQRDPRLLKHAPAASRSPDDDDWSSEEAVREQIAKLGKLGFPSAATSLLRVLLERQAPHFRPLLDEALTGRDRQSDRAGRSVAAQIAALSGPPQPQPRPRPSHLSGERLALSRAARGIVPLDASEGPARPQQPAVLQQRRKQG